MSFILGLLVLSIIMIFIMIYFPYVISHDEGFEMKKDIAGIVGKEAISPYTVYTNDFESGNAKRFLSRLPSVVNGGFSIPDEYTFHPVPDYHADFQLPVKDEPRSADFNRGSHNDPVHLYFQNLYGTLEDNANKA